MVGYVTEKDKMMKHNKGILVGFVEKWKVCPTQIFRLERLMISSYFHPQSWILDFYEWIMMMFETISDCLGKDLYYYSIRQILGVQILSNSNPVRTANH